MGYHGHRGAASNTMLADQRLVAGVCTVVPSIERPHDPPVTTTEMPVDTVNRLVGKMLHPDVARVIARGVRNHADWHLAELAGR